MVTLHSKVRARFSESNADGKVIRSLIETTPGRMKIAALLPHHPQIGHRLIEKPLTKKEIGNLIDIVYRHCGQKATVIFADQIMGLGFKEAAKAGISFGKDDIVIPQAKSRLVDETRKLVEEYEQQYADGLITRGEKYNKVVDAWAKSTDRVADEMMAEISTAKKDEKTGRELEVNSIYMMAHSGARGSQAQMKQLGGMRGLMAKPSGEIIETPIISNFKEGLTVLEYFNSTHGARKGLADTALKTANSGYLTRRLVDVAQDCIIVEEDCGTTRGITLRAVVEGGDNPGQPGRPHPGPRGGRGHQGPGHRRSDRAGRHLSRRGHDRDRRERGRAVGEGPLGPHLRGQGRRLRRLLWPRPGARHAGETSARRWGSSRPSPSASRAPSSPCAPSTSAAPPRWPSSRSSKPPTTVK